MKVYALIVGTSFATCHKGASSFKDVLDRVIPNAEIQTGATKTDFINGLQVINNRLISEPCIAITYYTGHGNLQGNREYYQFPDGNFWDTDFDNMVDSHLWHPSSLLIAFSDCCSGGEPIDVETNLPSTSRHEWITVSGTNRYEDAFVDGDGGVFTQVLVAKLQNLLDMPMGSWSTYLEDELSQTWIGILQHVTININNPELQSVVLSKLL